MGPPRHRPALLIGVVVQVAALGSESSAVCPSAAEGGSFAAVSQIRWTCVAGRKFTGGAIGLISSGGRRHPTSPTQVRAPGGWWIAWLGVVVALVLSRW